VHHSPSAGGRRRRDPIRGHERGRARTDALAPERSRRQSAPGGNRADAWRENGLGAETRSDLVERLMLNWIWLALVVLAVAIGGWNNRRGQHARTRQRRDAARLARDARFGTTQPATGRRFQR